MSRASVSPSRKSSASACVSPIAKHGRNGRTSTSSAAATISPPRRATHQRDWSTFSGSRSARAYAARSRSRSKKARTSAAVACWSISISGMSGAAVMGASSIEGYDLAGLRRLWSVQSIAATRPALPNCHPSVTGSHSGGPNAGSHCAARAHGVGGLPGQWGLARVRGGVALDAGEHPLANRSSFVPVFAILLAAVGLALSSPSAIAAAPPGTYFQGFERDTSGWFPGGDRGIARKPSGYVNGGYASGAPSASGQRHPPPPETPPPHPIRPSSDGPVPAWGCY